ncbi:MAG: amidophosphoribosyltransferase [Candidatus Gygaella obscura]|nr:amidophosphoribosyltransferase [Candidatus Gygaella obscura]
MVKESCGVFGVYGDRNASLLTYLGLYALQHRGQESAGIVVSDNGNVSFHRGLGLVNDVFSEEKLKKLKGDIAVGHVRYSTTGSSCVRNIQPFLVELKTSTIALGHNGNLINAVQLHDFLEKKGVIFQSTTDSEIIVHLITHAQEEFLENKVISSIKKLKGAFSLVFMMQDVLIGARDPFGFRPLCLGRLGKSFILASETSALDLINAKYIRDIKPGEVVFISKKGIKSVIASAVKRQSFCMFEYIYFARPDSNIFGHNVYKVRKSLGEQLAEEVNIDADLVVPIPDSGNYAALGFAQKKNIVYEPAVIRNHYIGRTFIEPSQRMRDLKVKLKLNPAKEVIKGKKIIIVEDSIVRGTTTKARIVALREAGAKKIHMLVSCPPIRYPCFYGIDFPTKKELIASSKSIEEIRRFLGLDSLHYLTFKGLLRVMHRQKNQLCFACFNGRYPEAVNKKISKTSLETR